MQTNLLIAPDPATESLPICTYCECAYPRVIWQRYGCYCSKHCVYCGEHAKAQANQKARSVAVNTWQERIDRLSAAGSVFIATMLFGVVLGGLVSRADCPLVLWSAAVVGIALARRVAVK